MNTEAVERRFSEMGARVRITERAPRPGNLRRWDRTFNRISGNSPVSLNILRDNKGEFFTISYEPEIEIDIVNVAVKDRHLLLVAKNGQDKSKFLCGHDERHWFVAAVPESAAGVTNVAKAKEALQPDSLRDNVKKLRKKQRFSRRNPAYKRQGEWFFTPMPGFEPPAFLVHHNDPITRGRGKPHIVEFLYREPGAVVYVGRSFENGERRTISAAQFAALDSKSRRHGMWTAQTAVAAAYAKGRVSHADHATIYLDCWHRIEMNTEQKARAMSHVQFVD